MEIDACKQSFMYRRVIVLDITANVTRCNTTGCSMDSAPRKWLPGPTEKEARLDCLAGGMRHGKTYRPICYGAIRLIKFGVCWATVVAIG